jgi:hypothetical protein
MTVFELSLLPETIGELSSYPPKADAVEVLLFWPYISQEQYINPCMPPLLPLLHITLCCYIEIKLVTWT